MLRITIGERTTIRTLNNQSKEANNKARRGNSNSASHLKTRGRVIKVPPARNNVGLNSEVLNSEVLNNAVPNSEVPNSKGLSNEVIKNSVIKNTFLNSGIPAVARASRRVNQQRETAAKLKRLENHRKLAKRSRVNQAELVRLHRLAPKNPPHRLDDLKQINDPRRGNRLLRLVNDLKRINDHRHENLRLRPVRGHKQTSDHRHANHLRPVNGHKQISGLRLGNLLPHPVNGHKQTNDHRHGNRLRLVREIASQTHNARRLVLPQHASQAHASQAHGNQAHGNQAQASRIHSALRLVLHHVSQAPASPYVLADRLVPTNLLLPSRLLTESRPIFVLPQNVLVLRVLHFQNQTRPSQTRPGQNQPRLNQVQPSRNPENQTQQNQVS